MAGLARAICNRGSCKNNDKGICYSPTMPILIAGEHYRPNQSPVLLECQTYKAKTKEEQDEDALKP